MIVTNFHVIEGANKIEITAAVVESKLSTRYKNLKDDKKK